MRSYRKWLLWLTPIIVIIIAVFFAAYLQATKPELSPKPLAEREWVVNVADVKIEEQISVIQTFGEIVTERDADMRTLVAGQVIEVSPMFKDGGLVKAGDMLVRIEPFEYKSRVEESKAMLLGARSTLSEYKAQARAEQKALKENKVQLKLATQELNRRKKLLLQNIVSQKHADDAAVAVSERSRIESASEEALKVFQARVKRQEAEILQVEVAISRAQWDLEHTELIAPFDGYLTSTEVAVGKRLSTNDRVARLLDFNQLEVKFHLPDQEYGRLISSGEGGLEGRMAVVLWRVGDSVIEFPSVIERIAGEIDSKSGGVHVFATINFESNDTFIRPGTFVEVLISGEVFSNSAKLPSSVLHNKNTIYVFSEGRLEKRIVSLLGRSGDHIIIKGELEDGEKVVTTRFSEIGPDIKVRTQ